MLVFLSQQCPSVFLVQSVLYKVPRPLQCWCGATSHQYCVCWQSFDSSALCGRWVQPASFFKKKNENVWLCLSGLHGRLSPFESNRFVVLVDYCFYFFIHMEKKLACCCHWLVQIWVTQVTWLYHQTKQANYFYCHFILFSNALLRFLFWCHMVVVFFDRSSLDSMLNVFWKLPRHYLGVLSLDFTKEKTVINVTCFHGILKISPWHHS